MMKTKKTTTTVLPHYLVDDYKDKINYPNHLKATEDCIYVYLIRNPLNGLCKIGITNNTKIRISQLENSSGMRLQMLIYIELEPNYDESALYIESYLHNFFNHKRVLGEWFNLSIKDIIAIRNLFYEIEGDYIQDNINTYLKKNHEAGSTF